MLIKTLLYTGVRVAELVAIRIDDIDLDACRIRITQGKGGKDRYVPFPAAFKETLALHLAAAHTKGAVFLFESSWKKPYSTRGVRAMLARYAAKAGLDHNMPPHRLRHFLFTWLKTQGIDDALIQPYSGHTTRTSLEIYSKIALSSRTGHLRQRHRPIPRIDSSRTSPTKGQLRSIPAATTGCTDPPPSRTTLATRPTCRNFIVCGW